MGNIHAIITGVGGYLPEYVMGNDELARMVDTNDEWIMTRIGVKERRILNEEGLGTAYMARKAAKQLLSRVDCGINDVDCVIVATSTPDYIFPSTASIVVGKLAMKRAFAYDVEASSCGFLTALNQAAMMIESGRYKHIVVIGADKMSSLIDYTDRSTCPLYGDGAGAVMVEASTEDGMGWHESVIKTDGQGLPFYCVKAGGSACVTSHYTLDHKLHYLHQDGRTVSKHAIYDMTSRAEELLAACQLSKEEITWFAPHGANAEIVNEVASNLDIPMERVMMNLRSYGNTGSASIPLLLHDYENKLKKGDQLLLTAFGAGFTSGAAWLTWAYNK